MLDHGRIAADGTPTELKGLIGERIVRATIPATMVDAMVLRPDAVEPASNGRMRVSFTLTAGSMTCPVLGALANHGDELDDLEISTPSLDDVFVYLATAGAES